MLYDTQEKLAKRGQEMDAKEIDRLIKLTEKLGLGSWPHRVLYQKFGIDGDFKMDGSDWGNSPEMN